MNPQTIETLLNAWEYRPKTPEWDEDDLAKIHTILLALKNALPDIREILANGSNSHALPPAVARNLTGEVSTPHKSSTGILEGSWKPRWEREATTPTPAPAASVGATPSNDVPTEPVEAPSSHSQGENQHTAGTVAASGQTPGISGKPVSASERLNAVRRTAAMSKPASSRAHAVRRTKVRSSTLP